MDGTEKLSIEENGYQYNRNAAYRYIRMAIDRRE